MKLLHDKARIGMSPITLSKSRLKQPIRQSVT